MQAGGDGKPTLLSLSLCLVGRRRRRDRSAAELVPSMLRRWNCEQSSPPIKLGRGRHLTAETQATMAAKAAGTPLLGRWSERSRQSLNGTADSAATCETQDASARHQEKRKPQSREGCQVSPPRTFKKERRKKALPLRAFGRPDERHPIHL